MTINDERERTIDFSDPYYSADQAGVVREDAYDLREALNAGLAAVRDDGRYAEIRDEWFAEA